MSVGVIMKRQAVRVVLLALSAGCNAPDESARDRPDSGVVGLPMVADTGIVQERADWEAFWRALPTDAAPAATALERYRRAKGLPFLFFVRPNAPSSVTAALRKEEDENGLRRAGPCVRTSMAE